MLFKHLLYYKNDSITCIQYVYIPCFSAILIAMIKVVFFDAGGVLHVSNTAVGDDLRKELHLSAQQIQQIFSYYVPLIGTGKMTEDQFWQAAKEEFAIRDVSASEHLLTRTFITTLQKMPGVYEYLDELKSQGVAVGLLTNVTPQFADILDLAGHYDPFELRILSYEVGIWKPDPAIYNYALNKAAVSPDEAVLIDDQVPNIVAADAIGMHGITFTDVAQLKRDVARLIKSVQ